MNSNSMNQAKSKNPMKFGTDGWRAKIAEEFTLANVQLVTQAFVDYLKDSGKDKKGIIVGYDNRFQSEDFARASAEICSGAGIKTYLTKHSVPSPVISFTVKNRNLGAGIMITASHNPPDWNGFKIKEDFGGSARPEVTKAVEAKLTPHLSIPPSDSNLEILDPDPDYLGKLKSLVNIDHIKKSKLKFMVDPMFGSGIGYFKKLGVPVTEIRGKRDPLFGGINPEPIPVNLEDPISFIKDNQEHIACIILDGDADRLAAIDQTGQFINTHNVFELLLHHLVVNRKLSGDIVKTFNLSNLIDKMCLKYKRKLMVTPIGFKHIAEKMISQDVLLGGEESGGMGIKGFVPERDGILAGLMLMELMATEKKTLAQIVDGFMGEHGYYYYDRADLHTEKARDIVIKLKEAPPKKFANKKVANIEVLDGLKLNFENNSWILFRASGTEPLLRVYVEARSEDEVKELLAAGEDLASPTN